MVGTGWSTAHWMVMWCARSIRMETTGMPSAQAIGGGRGFSGMYMPWCVLASRINVSQIFHVGSVGSMILANYNKDTYLC